MLVGVNAEEIARLVLAGCDEVERRTRQAQAGAPALVDEVLDHVRVGWPIPVPLPDPVKSLLKRLILAAVDEAAEAIYEAVAMFRALARAVGRPSALRAAAARLDDAVVARAKALAAEMQPSALLGLAESTWDSDATDPYETAFTEQSRALDSVGGAGTTLSDVLADMAASIEQFFSDLQLAFLGFALAVVGLVLAVATAAETLGVGAVIGLVVAVASYVAGVVGLVLAFAGASERHAAAAETLTSMEALSWPSSAFAR